MKIKLNFSKINTKWGFYVRQTATTAMVHTCVMNKNLGHIRLGVHPLPRNKPFTWFYIKMQFFFLLLALSCKRLTLFWIHLHQTRILGLNTRNKFEKCFKWDPFLTKTVLNLLQRNASDYFDNIWVKKKVLPFLCFKVA